jgi:hypothetical protein
VAKGPRERGLRLSKECLVRVVRVEPDKGGEERTGRISAKRMKLMILKIRGVKSGRRRGGKKKKDVKRRGASWLRAAGGR